MGQHIYFFGNGSADGRTQDKPLLGGKGANLAEMASLGLPVPPGFTLTTEVCGLYYDHDCALPESVLTDLTAALARLEDMTGKTFGGTQNPLLLSVRSGAAVSMPGMMDTILNLGLNDQTVHALAQQSGNERFAWDSYRRFIQMFGNVVLGIGHHVFEHEVDHIKSAHGLEEDTEMTPDHLKTLVENYKKQLAERDITFPQDPHEQLLAAVKAVFGSWNNERAITYRKIHNLGAVTGTAVNVQAMVFGNLGDTSATGVAFTRNPSTGENIFFGEYLVNAQGEDVVAGIRTPQPLNNAPESLEAVMPDMYAQLNALQQQLESHYQDMQDIEFTIEQGKLYLLQTRTGKRTARAMVRIAVEMVEEGALTKQQALKRIDPQKINELLHPSMDPAYAPTVLASGLPASPGVAVGKLVFSSDDAKEEHEDGQKVILVRMETSPEDIHGMHAAEGVLTVRGGMTSHAAVVARGMGKCCVCGCGSLTIDEEDQTLTIHRPDGTVTVLKKGDWISLNGTTGDVMLGQVPTVAPSLGGYLNTILDWADAERTLRVRTNADTPEAAAQAREFGAEGIGLCRTEHMFFEESRLRPMRAMILAETKADRAAALDQLLPFQIEDFCAIFRAMDGLPVTVRLLDPPLHEFLPEGHTEAKFLAQDLGMSPARVRERIEALEEHNPMLGLRGCRLGVLYPEITQMQARALFTAALTCAKEGITVIPEVMVPLVGHATELASQRALIESTAEAVFEEAGQRIDYTIGTMIELPRACMTAEAIAAHADFFSFGTNDLTQTTLGLSRDDAGAFLPRLVEQGVLEADPFTTLDQDGVGGLLRMGVEGGRRVTPNLKAGICGEHGGDPASIDFCHRTGLTYVSCSPFRVPIARIAAAQAALNTAH